MEEMQAAQARTAIANRVKFRISRNLVMAFQFALRLPLSSRLFDEARPANNHCHFLTNGQTSRRRRHAIGCPPSTCVFPPLAAILRRFQLGRKTQWARAHFFVARETRRAALPHGTYARGASQLRNDDHGGLGEDSRSRRSGSTLGRARDF